MKVLYRFLLLIAVMMAVSACELDNYSGPEAFFTGQIVDKKTKETIQTRQPNGIQIRLIQDGYDNPVPYDFWAKNDGTFRNTKLFAGTYEVTVKDGPFHGEVTKTITLKNGVETTETFEVEPYVRISDVNISVSAGTITGTYKLSMGDGTTEILHSRLICHVSPILHKNTDNLKSSSRNNLTGKTAAEVAAMSFSDQITGLSPGSYYVRVAAESRNVLGRNNYSKIKKVEVK